MCRLTAEEKTWEHARRKRRLAQQLALKKLKDADGGRVEVNTVETSSDTVLVAEENVDVKQADENPSEETSSVREEESGESSSKREPLLTCELWIEIESSHMEETVSNDDMFCIWMTFKDGSGGLDALQSLRQYLKNRLGVKRMVLDDPTRPVKKAKKKKKHSGVVASPN